MSFLNILPCLKIPRPSVLNTTFHICLLDQVCEFCCSVFYIHSFRVFWSFICQLLRDVKVFLWLLFRYFLFSLCLIFHSSTMMCLLVYFVGRFSPDWLIPLISSGKSQLLPLSIFILFYSLFFLLQDLLWDIC